MAQRVDQVGHLLLASGAVGFAVGADHALVDPPGRLDLDVVLAVEQRGQALSLPVGEQVGSGVQGPPGAVERVAGSTAVTVQVLLDPAPAAVQRVGGKADHVCGRRS